MMKVVHGVVRGRTIELDQDLEVEEGQTVEVQVKIVPARKRLPGPPPGWRPGSTETAAGMVAASWSEEDERIMEEIELERGRALGTKRT